MTTTAATMYKCGDKEVLLLADGNVGDERGEEGAHKCFEDLSEADSGEVGLWSKITNAKTKYDYYQCKSYKPMVLKVAVAVLVVLLSFCVIITLTLTISPGPTAGQKYIEGIYMLKKIGPNFEEYITSLGLPRGVADLLKELPEIVVVDVPENEASGKWTIAYSDGQTNHTLNFQLGKPFNISDSQHDLFHTLHLCDRPEENVLICMTNFTYREWCIRSRLSFSDFGLIKKTTNLNKGISMTKGFVRLKENEPITTIRPDVISAYPSWDGEAWE